MPGSGYAVLDLETTGFRPTDRILEVGVVLLDDALDVQDRWETLVQPHRDITNSNVHGICATDVRDAPLFAGIAAELAEILEDRAIVAHNAPFDARFLAWEYARLGIDLPPAPEWTVCTRTLSRRLLPGSPQKLADCLASAGLDNDRPHAAAADALATAHLYRHLRGRHPELTEPTGVLHVPWGRGSGAPAGSGRASRHPRGAEHQAGSWLRRIGARIPATGERDVDAYREQLLAALADGRLDAAEVDRLVDTAEALGLDRAEIAEVHTDYLRTLAVQAWADGVVTGDERHELLGAAARLGVDHDTVRALLATPPADGDGPGFALHPGDRVSLTGSMQLDRETWVAKARAAGLEVGGVVRRSALLVAADPESRSGKARRARELGVPIVDEPTFARLLGELEAEPEETVATPSAAPPGTDAPDAPAETPAAIGPESVFPWTAQLERRPRGPRQIAVAWLEEHPGRALHEISPRFRPEDFPECFSAQPPLIARWQEFYDPPLSATAADLSALRGFGRQRVERCVYALVLAALDADSGPAPETEALAGLAEPGETPRPAESDRSAAAPEVDRDHEGPGAAGFATDLPAGWSREDLEDSRPARQDQDTLQLVVAWQTLTAGLTVQSFDAAPGPVSAAARDLATHPFWADPAASAIQLARGEILDAIGADVLDVAVFAEHIMGGRELAQVAAAHDVDTTVAARLAAALRARLEAAGPYSAMLPAALVARFGALAHRDRICAELPELCRPWPGSELPLLDGLARIRGEIEQVGDWFCAAEFPARRDEAVRELAGDGGADVEALAEFLDVDAAELAAHLDTTHPQLRHRAAPPAPTPRSAASTPRDTGQPVTEGRSSAATEPEDIPDLYRRNGRWEWLLQPSAAHRAGEPPRLPHALHPDPERAPQSRPIAAELSRLAADPGSRVWLAVDSAGHLVVAAAPPAATGGSAPVTVCSGFGFPLDDDRLTGSPEALIAAANIALGLDRGAPLRRTVSRLRDRGQDGLAEALREL